MSVKIELDLPDDLTQFKLPAGVHARLHWLLDRQDEGHELTASEREEAEGLVELVDLLSLLRMKAVRAAS